jgi:hypothetical protein
MFAIIIKNSNLDKTKEIIDRLEKENIKLEDYAFYNYIDDLLTNFILTSNSEDLIIINSIYKQTLYLENFKLNIIKDNKFYIIDKNITNYLKKKKDLVNIINLNDFSIKFFKYDKNFIININFDISLLNKIKSYNEININLEYIKDMELIYEFRYLSYRHIITI